MNCVHPVRITKNLNPLIFPQGLEVPCGRCVQCKIQKRNEWSMRILHESSYYEKSVFVTLTYDEYNVPNYNSLVKRDLQLFIKRLRKNLANRKIKYFACGEYGENTLRPHYHLILFNVAYEENVIIKNTWNKGFIYVGSVTSDSITYTCKYIDKLYDNEVKKEIYDDTNREVPFKIQSKGIGLRFVIDNKEQLQNMGYVTVRGVKRSLPRYYIQKAEVDLKKIRDFQEESSKSFVKEVTGIDDLSSDDAMKWLPMNDVCKLVNKTDKNRCQNDKNLKARIGLKKRSKI